MRVRIARRVAALALGAVMLACHGDKKPTPVATAAAPPVPPPTDTMPEDLSKVQTKLPPATPDTFTRPVAQSSAPRLDYPPAPPALLDAVQREQAFTRFCYEEFGQKADPSLHGGVAVLVTIADNSVQDAEVANSRWSDKAPGDQVNQCLNEKARLAWKLGDASIRPGKYVVQLSFRGE